VWWTPTLRRVFRGDAIVGLHIRCLDTHAVAIRSDVGEATDRVYRAHEPHVLIQAGRSAAMAVSASGAGPDADTFSRQSEAVSAARPRWRAKNRAELSRSYSGTG